MNPLVIELNNEPSEFFKNGSIARVGHTCIQTTVRESGGYDDRSVTMTTPTM